MTEKLTPEQVAQILFDAGLAYTYAPIPEEEDGPILVWDGGCDARIAYRSDTAKRGWKFLTWGREHVDMTPGSFMWMRLPHPSIWLEGDAPPKVLDQKTLFETGDLKALLKRAPTLT